LTEHFENNFSLIIAPTVTQTVSAAKKGGIAEKTAGALAIGVPAVGAAKQEEDKEEVKKPLNLDLAAATSNKIA
jgi:hypothetical protein